MKWDVPKPGEEVQSLTPRQAWPRTLGRLSLAHTSQDPTRNGAAVSPGWSRGGHRTSAFTVTMVWWAGLVPDDVAPA